MRSKNYFFTVGFAIEIIKKVLSGEGILKKMKLIKAKDYEDLSLMAAEIISEQIKSKPDSVLGLGTGSSPLGTYNNLSKLCKSGKLDFSSVTTVNLDEYVGLDGSDDQSYRYFMDTNLFDLINIDKSRTFVPNGKAKDLATEGFEYDKMIEDLGGIDLQLLGIGLDGHIGFNEPDRVFIAPTHVIDLHESTIKANSRFFESMDAVPKKAITMGVGSIMKAKKILLIANGKNKKDIIEKAVKGAVDPMLPASILQLHPDVTVIYSED